MAASDKHANLQLAFAHIMPALRPLCVRKRHPCCQRRLDLASSICRCLHESNTTCARRHCCAAADQYCCACTGSAFTLCELVFTGDPAIVQEYVGLGSLRTDPEGFSCHVWRPKKEMAWQLRMCDEAARLSHTCVGSSCLADGCNACL